MRSESTHEPAASGPLAADEAHATGASPAARLFDRYVEAREAGRDPRLEELYREAGPESEELARRVRVYEELEDLGQILCGRELEGDEANELGRFRLLQTLATTKLSRVYRALDPTLGREVALKVFASQVFAFEDEESWMLNEGRSLARLEHPGVVRVFEHGKYDDLYYITMEYVRGPSLAQVLRCMGAARTAAAPGEPVPEAPPEVVAAARALALAPLRQRCLFVAEIARALAYCHERGVVHRDIKPSNVLLSEEGRPRLIDFGLAHLESDEDSGTRITQRLLGTPAYIAPEQVDSGRTGTSTLSDQFSLGVVLYELLTLRNPFDLGTLSGTMQAISRADPPRPRRLNAEIPEDLERICLHCLEIDPARRYPSMRALADDLQAFAEHRAISLGAPSPATLARLWLRRHRTAVRNAMIGAVAVAALLSSLWVARGYAVRERLRESLRTLDADWPAALSPDHFRARFALLTARDEIGRALDRELLLGGLLGAVGDDLERSWERGAARMLAVMEGFGRDRERLGLAVNPVVWRGLLDDVHARLPGFEGLERARLRGRVGLSAELEALEVELYCIDEGPGTPGTILVPEPFSSDLTGEKYRLVARDPESGINVSEGEFRLDPNAEYRVLERVERAPGFARAMVALEVAFAELEPLYEYGAPRLGQGPLQLEHFVPGGTFSLSRELVTWAELEAFVLAEGTEYAKQLELIRSLWDSQKPPGTVVSCAAPAIVPYDLAEAYARARGARIPTAFEIALARERGAVETPSEEFRIGGEISSTLTQGLSMSSFVDYSLDPRTIDTWFRFWSCSALPVFANEGGFGFRLAITGTVHP